MGVPEAGGAGGNPLGLEWGLPRPPPSWVWAASFLQLQGPGMCVGVCVRTCVPVVPVCACLCACAHEQERWRMCVRAHVCTQSHGMQGGRLCPGGWPPFFPSQRVTCSGVRVCRCAGPWCPAFLPSLACARAQPAPWPSRSPPLLCPAPAPLGGSLRPAGSACGACCSGGWPGLCLPGMPP